MTENLELLQIINKYTKPNNKNNAPNCVQKNIKYAASIHRRVLANLYKIKKEGTNNISYAKKNSMIESVKKRVYPAAKIN